MAKSLQEQMANIFPVKQEKTKENNVKSNRKLGNVVVSYRSNQVDKNELNRDKLASMEKKIIEARSVSFIEKENSSLKYKLDELSNSLELQRQKYLALEIENSRLRAKKTIEVENIEKSTTSAITKSKEYKALLVDKNAIELNLKDIKTQLNQLNKQNKNLCIEMARVLKKSLKEASLPLAKREKHQRNIKEIEEGNISTITEVLAVLSYISE